MHHKILMPLICALSLSACVTPLKRAEDFLVLSYNSDNTQNSSVDNTAGDAASASSDLDVLDGDSDAEVLSNILSAKTVSYAAVAGAVEQSSDSYFPYYVMNGMLLKSDRVCKAYLDDIIQTRNVVKISNQALSSLPSIIAALSSSGTSSFLTAGDIANVQNGATNALKDLGIGSEEVRQSIEEVREIRSKMRIAVNTQIARKDYDYYDIFAFLVDLESYHGACSLFDQIFYNFKVPEKLAELNAYRLLDEDDADDNKLQMELLK